MIDWKIFGAALVCGASTWTGFQAAANVRKSYRQLGQLRLSLELMRCEISCRRTPARKLAGILADACKGEISRFYAGMENELLRGRSVSEAARQAGERCRLVLPREILQGMQGLFSSFGSFDADGQLRLVELEQARVAAALDTLAREQNSRCRCYEILGACTGLSLAILVA